MSRFNPIHKRAWLTDNVKRNFSLNLYVIIQDHLVISTSFSQQLAKYF